MVSGASRNLTLIRSYKTDILLNYYMLSWFRHRLNLSILEDRNGGISKGRS